MATLSSLGYSDTRRNQAQPLQKSVGNPSTAVTQGKQVTSGLLNDIQKLGIGAEKIATSSYQASELASQMVINDKVDKYNEGTQGIDDYFYKKESQGQALTSKDYKDWKQWRDNHYNQYIGGSELVNDNIDKNKEMYKKSFFRPIMQEHHNMNKKLATAYRSTLLTETVASNKEYIDKKGSTLTSDKVHEMITHEKILGNTDASTSIYSHVAQSVNDEWTNKFKNGANSVAFKPYVNDIMDGTKTLDEAFREIYNESYKEFSSIGADGQFHKVDKELTDTAHEQMKKSYSSWLSVFKKEKDKAVDVTAAKPANAATVKDSVDSLNTLDTQLKAQTIEFGVACNGSNDKACNSLKELRNAQVNLASTIATKNELEKSVYAYQHDKYNDTSFLDETSEVATTTKSLTNGKDVVKIRTIYPEEKSDYLHDVLKNNLTSSLSSDKLQIDAVNGLADKISGLQSKHNGSSNVKALNVVKTVANGSAINNANSMEEIVNNLQFAYEYKTKGGLNSYSGINKPTLDRIISDYNSILKDDTINNDKKLAIFKQVAYAEVQTKGKPLYMRTEEVMKKFGVTNPDNFISGLYNAGDTIPISGALDIAFNNTMNNGKTYTNQDDLLDDIKKQTIVLDSAIIPFFGKSLMAVKPSTTVHDSVLINNFEEQVKKHMVEFPEVFTMNFGELSRNDKIQVRQIKDDKNGITTFVDIIDSDGITKTIVIDEADWLHSMTPKERKVLDTKYNSLYNTETNTNISHQRKHRKNYHGKQ